MPIPKEWRRKELWQEALPAVLRTSILLLSLGLAALFSRDGRGLHDVAAGTAVVRG